ncbi:MAG TPA: hypothetical protein VGJ59_18425 [Jatrophihabitantaceae bacterium]|jgi:hypothetical protein
MQPLLVDAEMVADLVDDCDRDLVSHLVLVRAHCRDRQPVHGDRVGQGERVVGQPVRQRGAVVDAEQRRFVRVFVGGLDHDIVEQPQQFRGDRVECLADKLLEPAG